MTNFRDARATLAATGWTLTRKDGEYRLCREGGTEASAYYTTDLDDACYTAIAEDERKAAQADGDSGYIELTPAQMATRWVAPDEERLDTSGCTCDHLSPNPGPHHDEGCPLYQLPDYGVFGPDE